MVLEEFGDCSVDNLSIAGLYLSMFVSRIMGIFFAGSLEDCVDGEIEFMFEFVESVSVFGF